MRVSGVVLLFMALGHLAIMHLLHGVEEIDYDFVAARFATPFWRSYDFVMLVLALLHGVNGARTVLEDYVHSGGWRTVTLSTLYIVGFVLLVVGALVILTFQPVAGGR
jgi:succinate dehydrogenase / fumarate reductase membrane anchor subunit